MKTLLLSIFLALAVSVNAQCETGCATCTSFGLAFPDECQRCDEDNGWTINSAGTLCIQACPLRQFATTNQDGFAQCRACTQGCSSCTATGLTTDVCQACDEVLGWNLNLAENTCVQSCPLGQFVDLEPARDQCEPCTTGCSACAGRDLNVRPNGLCAAPIAGANCIECNQAIGWRLQADGCTCVEACESDEFNDQTTGVDICTACSNGCAQCNRLGLSVSACSLCDEAAGFKLNRAGTGCVATCAAGESVVENESGRLQCSLVCTTGCLTCTAPGLTVDVCQVCDEANGWLLDSAAAVCVQACADAEYADFEADPAICTACTTGCASCSDAGLEVEFCVCDEANGFYVSVDGLVCTECTATQYVDFSVEPAACVEFSQSQSRTFGDPHMVGLLGQKYLFDGEAGKIYNVISTPDFQVNMQLIESHDGEIELAVIGEIGIIVGDDSIFVNKDARLRINNVLASDITLLSDKKSSLVRDTFHDGKGIIVRTPEFMIRMVPRGYEVDIKEIRMLRRGDKSIHGIVGQTWSAANWPASAFTTEVTDQKTLFQGLIEGSSVADYEVKDGLFGANFTFSRFDTVAHPIRHVVPEVSKTQ